MNRLPVTRHPYARQPTRPVPRRLLLVVLVVIVAALSAAIDLVEELRHPPAGGEPPLVAVDSDPREAAACPEPELGTARRRRVPADARGTTFEVTSNALYECPALWHLRSVRFRGEVVGAVLRRGEHAWVQLNDDVYAVARGPLPAHRDYQGGNAGVGVRIPLALADQIEWVGDGQARGDVLEVTGTFHRVLQMTGDAAVIVADVGEVVQRGSRFVDPILPDRAVAAWVVAAVALALAVAERVVARRRR